MLAAPPFGHPLLLQSRWSMSRVSAATAAAARNCGARGSRPSSPIRKLTSSSCFSVRDISPQQIYICACISARAGLRERACHFLGTLPHLLSPPAPRLAVQRLTALHPPQASCDCRPPLYSLILSFRRRGPQRSTNWRAILTGNTGMRRP
ncbi:hypothetical protein B0J12DRAFT_23370 [Macrophomina phaseolina]|uniref:Uncharacterized protein n=1 Tax=Macrophomina phaseolina TaxID=35725 RepID=A0ABQ8GUV6_9PEZI|nr:hypothetical protein B0J12DRAFT_23370 [Macrophomina phaseolina]